MRCAYCKKDFIPAYNSSIYCSKECARKAYNYQKRKKRAMKRGLTEKEAEAYAKENEYKLKTCARPGCEKQFLPKNNKQKYCSKTCAKNAKPKQMQSGPNKTKYTSCHMEKSVFVRRLAHDLYYGR